MNMINIDGKEYDIDLFSEEAKAQLNSIKFIDAELARLNAQAAALKTARNAYITELKRQLDLYAGDTIRFE